MCEVMHIKSEKLFPFISTIIEHDGVVRLTVTGMSMHPFMREGIDSVELTQVSFDKIIRGSIVIIHRDSAEYIMHRVLKKTLTHFYIIGDAQQWIEGPLRPDQLVAKVTAVWRGDKRIECTNFWWRLLSALWLRLIPVRHIIFGSYRCLRRVCSFFQLGGRLHEKKS